MLSDGLKSTGWPQKQVDITITPGGFIRAPFPLGYERDGGKCGWGSDAYFKRLIPAASKQVKLVIGSGRTMDRLRRRSRLLTLGVDLTDDSTMRAELVCVTDTEAGAVIHWTGKSYPVSGIEERTLVQAPLQSHLLEFGGKRMLVLGCHDLNLFSQRARNRQGEGSTRRKRCDAMRKLAKKFNPVSVLQHPHTTDTPKIWSVAWAGVRQQLPGAETLASGIAYCHWGDTREPLDTVRKRTAWGADITDIVVEGPWPVDHPSETAATG
ncbi:MAG: hypothetical protein OXK82_13385 [Deltaproteobacteria bacterium]|nr:hypothetical protein [Deltaproteobacteria bacterium]